MMDKILTVYTIVVEPLCQFRFLHSLSYASLLCISCMSCALVENIFLNIKQGLIYFSEGLLSY